MPSQKATALGCGKPECQLCLYAIINSGILSMPSPYSAVTVVLLAYNYAAQPVMISPFEKLIKSNTLALLRDINFSRPAFFAEFQDRAGPLLCGK